MVDERKKKVGVEEEGKRRKGGEKEKVGKTKERGRITKKIV